MARWPYVFEIISSDVPVRRATGVSHYGSRCGSSLLRMVALSML